MANVKIHPGFSYPKIAILFHIKINKIKINEIYWFTEFREIKMVSFILE